MKERVEERAKRTVASDPSELRRSSAWGAGFKVLHSQ